MALTQEFIDAVAEAQNSALQALNTPAETIYPSQQNRDIVLKLLSREGIAQQNWTNVSIWVSAFVQARAEGLLEARPSQAEVNLRREIADRKDGNQRYLSNKENREAPKNGLSEMFNNLNATLNRKPGDQKQVEAEKVTFPTIEVDYQDMDDENKRLYRSLSTTDMRAWMKKRAVRKHEQLYGTAV